MASISMTLKININIYLIQEKKLFQIRYFLSHFKMMIFFLEKSGVSKLWKITVSICLKD